MAHQDYVSRTRSPKKKKNTPYQQKAVESRHNLPTKVKLIGLTTLVAIAAFTYLLWSIKDNQPVNEPTKTVEIATTKKTADLPNPPKEKWAYMKELKSKEVEVGEYTVNDKGPYKMQCGSFRTEKQAKVMKANIAFSGLSAQISAVKGSSGTWYKVFLGPYEKKRQAEKEKHQLRSNNISTCQIWLWN